MEPIGKWVSVSIEDKLILAVDAQIETKLDEFQKPKWQSRAKFIAEAIEEKLRKERMN